MKTIVCVLASLMCSLASQAQGIDFGIKAGANFANFNGDIESDGITSFHAGAVLEVSVVPMFSVQAEGLFSSVGGKAKYEQEGVIGVARDINLDYISVPVMAKFYVVPEFVSLMAGPQVSFLVSDTEEAFAKPQDFDLGVTGGVEAKLIAGIFAQARYTIGITDVYEDVNAKNSVFQLSVGYTF